MCESVVEQLSVLRSRLRSRTIDDSTLQILESVSLSKDVTSLVSVKSTLKELLRSESLFLIHGMAEKTDDKKLLVLDFLVRAFAIIGDNESCLALRYEALNFRQSKSWNHQWIRVSYVEWLNFAEHSLHAGFSSIAAKAYEHALSCFKQGDTARVTKDCSLEFMEMMGKIKRLKDHALTTNASHSVQALTSKYLKTKVTERNRKSSPLCKESQSTASTLFRNGIRNRNARKLRAYRTLQGTITRELY